MKALLYFHTHRTEATSFSRKAKEQLSGPNRGPLVLSHLTVWFGERECPKVQTKDGAPLGPRVTLGVSS